MENRFRKIRKAILTKPYIFFFILFFFAYLALDAWVNELNVTVPTLFNSNLKIVIPYVVFTFLLAGLVALVINLVIIKFRELKKVNKVSGIAAVGLFTGILGGGCASCFAGLFPAFIGLFGITASLSSLPLYGLEIQIVSIILLITSVYFLTKSSVCGV